MLVPPRSSSGERTSARLGLASRHAKLVTGLALLAITAGSEGSVARKAGASASIATPAGGWDPAALEVADGLAAKLRASGSACTEYARWSYLLLDHEYRQNGLPMPAAVTACTGDGAENLTFEVFGDRSARAKFVEAKRQLLCEAAARAGFGFPGFVYLDGGRWIVEPDERETAASLAKILGGRVRTATCR